jgi:uncharacterized protein (DUF2267 family)
MTEKDFLTRVQAATSSTRCEAQAMTEKDLLTRVQDLLDDSQARRRFAAQLPGSLKARLREEPPRGLRMDADAFLQHLAAALGTHAPEAQRALRAVWTTLEDAVSPGELDDVRALLPKDFGRLLGGPVP